MGNVTQAKGYTSLTREGPRHLGKDLRFACTRLGSRRAAACVTVTWRQAVPDLGPRGFYLKVT